jgi:hypothetical protein
MQSSRMDGMQTQLPRRLMPDAASYVMDRLTELGTRPPPDRAFGKCGAYSSMKTQKSAQ